MMSPGLKSWNRSRPMPQSKPAAHLGGVVLEAPQRGDLALVDDPVVAQQPHAGGARDDPLDDVAAGDRADLGHLEGVAHLGAAADDLAEGRVEQARHGAFAARRSARR